MDKATREKYVKLTHFVEEPIQEIVSALWGLPFVVDTGHTCSGHMVHLEENGRVHAQKLNEGNVGQLWYPHRPSLEIFYAVDGDVETRDRFRAALTSVTGSIDGKVLRFDRVSEFDSRREHVCTPQFLQQPVLMCRYLAGFEEGEKKLNNVLEKERLFQSFWEAVAKAIQPFAQNRDIHVPSDENAYRKVITLEHWKLYFGFV